MAQGVGQQVRKMCAALALPSDSEMTRVNNAMEPKPPLSAKSNFVRLLATHRHFFAGMVFIKGVADQDVGFRLLFATQSPLRAFFLPVFPVDCEFPLLPHGMHLLERQRRMAHISLFEFEWIPSTYITDKGIGEMDDFGKVWVFEDMHFKKEKQLGGSVLPSLLEVFAERHYLFRNS